MKVAVISYNPIDGVDLGRTETGNVITYSGHWGAEIYQDLAWLGLVSGVLPGPGNPFYDSAVVNAQVADAEHSMS